MSGVFEIPTGVFLTSLGLPGYGEATVDVLFPLLFAAVIKDRLSSKNAVLYVEEWGPEPGDNQVSSALCPVCTVSGEQTSSGGWVI